MVNLTIKDLTHHKGKLVLIFIGLIVSVFLIQFSVGMYFGSIKEYSRPAKEWDHDAWVTAEDMEMLMVDGLVDDEVYDEVKDIDGIKEADEFIFSGGSIEGEDDVKFIYIYGIDLDSDIEPWGDMPSDWDDKIEDENSIILDDSILSWFPDLEKGDKININNRVEFKIAGFSTGNILMGTPFAWCSRETAQNIYPFTDNFSTAIGVKFDSGYTFEEFKEDTEDIKDISVYTSTEIEENTDDFILNKIGAGMIIAIMAGMGFIVGIIIVSITVYQNVLEKIPVFGTLKAIGAEKKFLNKMLFGQVFILMTISFILGTLLTVGMAASGAGFMQITVDLIFTALLYVIMLVVSFICAYFSIKKVHDIDPAVVFRR